MDMVDLIYAKEYQKRAASAAHIAMRFRLLILSGRPRLHPSFLKEVKEEANHYAALAAEHHRNMRKRMDWRTEP